MPLVQKQEHVGVIRLFGLSAYFFATGLLLSTLALVTLALEARHLAPSHATLALPGLLSIAGVSQLACPLAGALSDRHRSKYGRRRPFIFWGTAVLSLSLATQWAARAGVFGESLALAIYGLAFFAAMVSLNFAYTAATSLVPDLVPPEQTGVANGVATLAQVAGSFFGFLFYFVVDDLDALYGLYVSSVLLASAATITAATGLERRKRLARAGADVLDNGDFTDRLRRRRGSWGGAAPGHKGGGASFIDTTTSTTATSTTSTPSSTTTTTTTTPLPPLSSTGLLSSSSSSSEHHAVVAVEKSEVDAEQEQLVAGPHAHPEEPGEQQPLRWSELRGLFFAAGNVSASDPNSSDFFWVWISRTLYYLGGSTNSFLQFYLRDRLRRPSSPAVPTSRLVALLSSVAGVVVPPNDPARATCGLALAGYVAGGLAAVPSGALSDRVGRKPLVVAACFFMIVALFGLAESTSPNAVLAFALLGGLGNGTYQSVDLALAVDTLPDPREAAMYMGIWGIGAFIGASLGPAIGGPLLLFFGKLGASEEQGEEGGRGGGDGGGGGGGGGVGANSKLGYFALFGCYGTFCFFASAAVLLKFVKKAA